VQFKTSRRRLHKCSALCRPDEGIHARLCYSKAEGDPGIVDFYAQVMPKQTVLSISPAEIPLDEGYKSVWLVMTYRSE